ncbi:MAG: YggT family protein [Gemmatimonadetes bacterium]|jgi:YggT family protein|nr:YggT family protein [Gemmatimonadota bacterium]
MQRLVRHPSQGAKEVLFDFGGFFNDVFGLIRHLIWVYIWILFIRVAISWTNIDQYNPIVQFLRGITDPVVDAFRRVLPRFCWSSGLDFTPLILSILLLLIVIFLNNLHF